MARRVTRRERARDDHRRVRRRLDDRPRELRARRDVETLERVVEDEERRRFEAEQLKALHRREFPEDPGD